MPKNETRHVYSTDGGRVREVLTPHNRRVDATGRVPTPSAAPPGDGIVRVQRDKRGRGGKTATTITGLPGTEDELDALLKTLKQTCGAGGTREGRILVIQGDQRERLMEKLSTLGVKPKLAGG